MVAPREPSPTPFIDPQTFRQKGFTYQVLVSGLLIRRNLSLWTLVIEIIPLVKVWQAKEFIPATGAFMRVLAKDTET